MYALVFAGKSSRVTFVRKATQVLGSVNLSFSQIQFASHSTACEDREISITIQPYTEFFRTLRIIISTCTLVNIIKPNLFFRQLCFNVKFLTFLWLNTLLPSSCNGVISNLTN